MRTRWFKVSAILAALLAASVLPAVAADPPTVTIHTDKTHYVAGQTAHVTFTISNAGQNTHLKVVVTWADGTQHVYNDTDVYTDNVPPENVYMYYDSTIQAYVANQTEPSDTVVVPVQASVGSAISGYYQRSGSYAIFAKGSSPRFNSATSPAHAGRCLKHEVWRQYASGWKPILLSSCSLESAQGIASWQWAGTHGSGVHFRVRAKFLGDRLNHPNAGPFIYFKFA